MAGGQSTEGDRANNFHQRSNEQAPATYIFQIKVATILVHYLQAVINAVGRNARSGNDAIVDSRIRLVAWLAGGLMAGHPASVQYMHPKRSDPGKEAVHAVAVGNSKDQQTAGA